MIASQDILRELALRGSDKLLESMRELRLNIDHLRRLLVRTELPVDAGYQLDRVHDEMGRVESMLVNMQSSAVKLPDPRRARSAIWEVPVTHEFHPLSWNTADMVSSRFFRIQFRLDGTGPTWKWRLAEQVLDTGIEVRP